MKRLSFALIAVLLFVAAVATAEKKSKPDPKADEVIMATTDDGRRVALLGNGTWKFVAGEAPKKEEGPTVKEQAWKDVVAYFASWKMEVVDDKAGLVKTDWNQVPQTGAFRLYKVRVSIVVGDDGTIKMDVAYQGCDSDGCLDATIEGITKVAGVPGVGTDAKKVVAFDAKLRADLAAIEAKYKK